MKYVVIIPAHNEAHYLSGLLDSLIAQTEYPEEIILVNDHSTDETEIIMQQYAQKYDWINYLNRISTQNHQPGAKVVAAFKEGLEALTVSYDILVKLDADLVLPNDYFEVLLNAFEAPNVGIAGGFCYEKDGRGVWKKNHPMHNDHVRGAFKAYRKECYEQIGGIRSAMGWDTLDELLGLFHGFSSRTLPQLKVKHLRPLGNAYSPSKAARLQGEAFYRMRYGFLLSFLAICKYAWNKKSMPSLWYLLGGFMNAFFCRTPFLVNPVEGVFIRNYRWSRIRHTKGIKK